MPAMILLVEDEESQRKALGGFLEKQGYRALLAESGNEALSLIQDHTVDIMITDQKMHGMSGIELAGIVRTEHPNISVVILTAFGTVEDAVQAMRDGVEDYLTKPIDLTELDVIITKILDKRQLLEENRWLKEQLRQTPKFPDIIHSSKAMETVLNKVARAAESRATVLITGESGTGKEIVARAVHGASDRSDKAFIAVNCSAVPEGLIESDLFGHEKGAFTGADQQRIGRFEQADHGTLFLDEIAEIPLHIQVKLLRILQERSFERVGGNTTISVDVRIVVATNRNLEEEIKRGRFREDLFYRLNVVGIHIPPLRERKADIPVLVEHYIKEFASLHKKPIASIAADALDRLIKYPFPGNVRELSNIIEHAVVLLRGEQIILQDLPLAVSGQDSEMVMDSGTLEDRVTKLEQTALREALDEAGGNKSAAARLLGISERKIRYMIKKYGINN